jgi:hypothetical protein
MGRSMFAGVERTHHREAAEGAGGHAVLHRHHHLHLVHVSGGTKVHIREGPVHGIEARRSIANGLVLLICFALRILRFNICALLRLLNICRLGSLLFNWLLCISNVGSISTWGVNLLAALLARADMFDDG